MAMICCLLLPLYADWILYIGLSFFLLYDVVKGTGMDIRKGFLAFYRILMENYRVVGCLICLFLPSSKRILCCVVLCVVCCVVVL